MDKKEALYDLIPSIQSSKIKVEEHLIRLSKYPEGNLIAIARKYRSLMMDSTRTGDGKYPFITHVPEFNDQDDTDLVVEFSLAEPGVSLDAEEEFINKHLGEDEEE